MNGLVKWLDDLKTIVQTSLLTQTTLHPLLPYLNIQSRGMKKNPNNEYVTQLFSQRIKKGFTMSREKFERWRKKLFSQTIARKNYEEFVSTYPLHNDDFLTRKNYPNNTIQKIFTPMIHFTLASENRFPPSRFLICFFFFT